MYTTCAIAFWACWCACWIALDILDAQQPLRRLQLSWEVTLHRLHSGSASFQMLSLASRQTFRHNSRDFCAISAIISAIHQLHPLDSTWLDCLSALHCLARQALQWTQRQESSWEWPARHGVRAHGDCYLIIYYIIRIILYYTTWRYSYPDPPVTSFFSISTTRKKETPLFNPLSDLLGAVFTARLHLETCTASSSVANSVWCQPHLWEEKHEKRRTR